jgi:hypothetical protein
MISKHPLYRLDIRHTWTPDDSDNPSFSPYIPFLNPNPDVFRRSPGDSDHIFGDGTESLMCKGLETRSQEGRFGSISLMRFGFGQRDLNLPRPSQRNELKMGRGC